MQKRLLLSICFLLLGGLIVQAQNLSWKQHKKEAEAKEAEGENFEAAENYRMAWEKKQSKEELIYQAAELYYNLKSYREAAGAYQHVPDYDDDPLVRLKYGRALKQDGQYDKAREVFRRLIDTYSGSDKAILTDIVQIEIRGIDLARELPNQIDRRLEILRPGNGINTESMETAPVPIDGTKIYFTSNMGEKARIYESSRDGRNWTKAATPENFPVIQNGQYGDGCISPDGQRFYFSICEGEGGLNGKRCEIYMARKTSNNGWGAPERLPDYVNDKGVTATQPTVAHIAGQEYLYFVSNREGGRGGMDIWYSVRDLGLDNNDFTFPINLGPSVNTLGNEITPFFNADEGKLYFASNGHVSIGGYDVYSSKGEDITWATPVNVGMPINSSADDYGYVRARSGFGGFLVSNRAFGGEKTNTRDSDVFELTVGGRQMVLRSNVYDKVEGVLLDQLRVTLFQIFDDGRETNLVSRDFNGGGYLFDLLPNRRFRVQVESPGYLPAGYTFTTDDPSTYTYGQPLYLNLDPMQTQANRPADNMPNNNPNTRVANNDDVPDAPGRPMTQRNTENVQPLDESQRYTSRGTSNRDNLEYVSEAPRYEGTYYKIQLAAVRRFDPNASNYQAVSTIGRFDTENLPDRGLVRVLLGDFFTEEEARSALSQIKSSGFSGAYPVRYDNGVRYGRVNF